MAVEGTVPRKSNPDDITEVTGTERAEDTRK